MSEYIITVDENDERWHYVEQQYTHFFGYPIAGEIVRCRDCQHKRRSWNGREPNFIGNWFCAYTGGHEVEPDGFCKWGERRGE